MLWTCATRLFASPCFLLAYMVFSDNSPSLTLIPLASALACWIWLAAIFMALAALLLADALATLMSLLALDWTLARFTETWLLKEELMEDEAWAILSLACWLAWEIALDADDCVRDSAWFAWSAFWLAERTAWSADCLTDCADCDIEEAVCETCDIDPDSL